MDYSGLKISISISFVLHLLVIALFFLIPLREPEERGPFVARLVTPEEMGEVMDKDSRIRIFEGSRGPVLEGSGGQKRREHRGEKSSNERDAKKMERQTETKESKGSVIQQFGGRENSATENKTSSPIPIPPTPSYTKQDQQSFGITPPTESPKVSPILPREKLFDKEVVERLAKREREDVKTDKGITFDTDELRYYSYMQRLKEKIEGIWRYPPEAAEKGIYGDLYIRFMIKKDGRLGNVELLRTSGYRSLDDAAMKALRDASPFWPLPDEWKKEELIITGHFIYSLYGVYLR